MMKIRSILLFTVVFVAFGCSNSSDGPGDVLADSGAAGDAEGKLDATDAAMNDALTAETDAQGPGEDMGVPPDGGEVAPDSLPVGETAAEVDDAATDVTLPYGATCGGVPILGAQGANSTAECKACMDASCCNAAEACAASPDCIGFRICFATCPDDPCKDACDDQFPNGMDESDAVAECRNTNCWSECNNYSCIGNVTYPEPTVDTYDVAFVLTDLMSGAGIDGALVAVCAFDDVDCENPLDEGLSMADGSLTITVPSAPTGLGAYIQIVAEGYPDVLGYYPVPPGSTTYTSGDPTYLSMVSTQTLGLLSDMVGITPDPARGHVIFRFWDCVGFSAGGIVASVDTADASTKVVYLAGGMPSETLTSTDDPGDGAIMNIPVGKAVVSGNVEADKAMLGKLNVIIRPGAVTAINVVPSL